MVAKMARSSLSCQLAAVSSQERPEMLLQRAPSRIKEKLNQDTGKIKYSLPAAEFLLNNYKDIGIFAVL
jgi:hypothetical protein